MAYNRQISDAASSTAQRRIGHDQEVSGPMRCPHGFILATRAQRRRYQFLSRRELLPTKYMDPTVLDTLGFRNDFDWFLGNLGCATFINAVEPTFAALTMEFLSFVVTDTYLEDSGPNDGRITFRLCNTQYSFSFDQLNTILGVPLSDFKQAQEPPRFSFQSWWSNITIPGSPPFYAGENPVSVIPNPCFRYFHLLLNQSVLPNGGTSSNATASELLFMTTIVYNFKMNTGAFLAEHLVKVGMSSPEFDGPITVGGGITTIARGVGLNLEGLQPVPGRTLIDIQCCVEAGIVVEDDGIYWLPVTRANGEYLVRLPNHQCTTISQEINWRFPGHRRPRRS